MASKTCWALAGLLMLGTASGASAAVCEQGSPQQGQKPAPREERREPFENHPRYKWWADEKAMAAAGFGAEQGAQIDRIFHEAIDRMRPIREEVMQLQKQLNQTIDANVADVAVFARQVDKIETKRAELNKQRLVMLYGMHRVLTPEQNTKLLAYFEKREAERRKQDGDRRR